MDAELFKYDFCVDTKEFSEIGIGIYLYFMYMKFIFFVLFAIFSIVCCAQLYITRKYNIEMQDICKTNTIISSSYNDSNSQIIDICIKLNNQIENNWIYYFNFENLSKNILLNRIL